MKKFLFLIIIFFPIFNFGQVIISPYIVNIDESNRFGSFIVQNESNDPYEISISFKFGYPVSDSSGTVFMRYHDSTSADMPSIVDWLRAFPKKFVLHPRQRQVIRMSARPPDGLPAGTYWSRIITSAAPQLQTVDTLSTGISAQIKFILNQVTTILYRTGDVNTSIELSDITTNIDSTALNILATFKRGGNSPFFGNLDVEIFNSSGKIVKNSTEFLTIYYDMQRKVTFDINDLPPGSYKAKLKVTFNEKEDIPGSKMHVVNPEIVKEAEVFIPQNIN